jgi:NAD(P)-dependent dehydrogenase (short-subunit alcohol dehydrogenase family)
MNSKNIFDLISLKNKVSIVTGGAGHLGSAISESLAELGSNIIIIGRDDKKGKRFTEELSSNFNINANFIKADLNSKQSIDSIIKNIDKIDILINNAFTWPTIPKIEDTEWDDFEQTLSTGITSPFYMTKKSAEIMKKSSSGNIINIGSMYGMVSPNFKIYQNKPNMGNALAYNASKAAIIQMTKYQAVHYAKWNIRVNCISPGPFPHPGTFANGKEWFESELKEMNPLHKLGEPWHLKGSVALLASSLGDYMTGQNITVDGGWTIW